MFIQFISGGLFNKIFKKGRMIEYLGSSLSLLI